MLDHRSPIPLYYQIEAMLREKIENGVWKPGMLLPSERELCRMFNVSRGPVRQALHDLETDGLIYAIQGKGVIVNEKPLPLNPLVNASFFKEIERLGMKPSSEVINQEIVLPSPEVSRILKLKQDEKLLLIKRLIKGDAVPLAVAVTHLPAKLFPGIAAADLTEMALYDLIVKKYKIEISRVQESFEPVEPDAETSRLLNFNNAKPVLMVHRISYSVEKPVDYTTLLVGADRCRYTLEIPVCY